VEAAVIASEEADKTPVTGEPKVTPAPKEGELPTDPPNAEKTGTEGNDDQPRFSSAKLRIRELVRERNQYRNERDAANSRLARLSQPLVPEDKKADLDYDQRETLRIREASRAERKDELQEQVQTLHERSMHAAATAVIEQLNEASDPALKPILEDPRFPLSDEIIEFLADTDQAVAVAKHLSQNRDIAFRLETLTSGKGVTRASLREADRILLGIEARARAGVVAQPRRATQAPNPGTTLRGGAPPPTEVSLSDLAKKEDAGEYIKRREAEWAKGGK
jgi:hypothetical protein